MLQKMPGTDWQDLHRLDHLEYKRDRILQWLEARVWTAAGSVADRGCRI